MNFATALIGLVIAALLVLAVRYLVRNGMCAGCDMSGSCSRAKKASAAAAHGCSGSCEGCAYHEAEMKVAAARRQTRTGV